MVGRKTKTLNVITLSRKDYSSPALRVKATLLTTKAQGK